MQCLVYGIDLSSKDENKNGKLRGEEGTGRRGSWEVDQYALARMEGPGARRDETAGSNF